MKYRVDHKCDHEPTISTLAIDATDFRVATSRSYVLNIRHCRTWKPSYGERRGFMPHVDFYVSGASMCNGDVHHGTDEAAYALAVKEGMEIMARMQKELDDDIARMDALRYQLEQEKFRQALDCTKE